MFARLIGAGALPRPTDWIASWVVFLVALPLSMGIALACGAPVEAGLVSAAIGGLVAGALGGAPLLVSGPSAGSAVLVVAIAAAHGYPAVAVVTLGCGLLQIGLCIARAGNLATAVAPPVLHGMLAGMGLLIVISQACVVLGHAPLATPWESLMGMGNMLQHASLPSLGVGLLTMAVLVAWPRRARVPGALVAVAAGTYVAWQWQLPVSHITLPQSLWQLRLPQVDWTHATELLGAAVAMALVVSTESLLSALAVDRLHDGPRVKLDKELGAQGIANVLSGLFGGLPVTGVIVRGTTNVQAGAKTRWSAMLHGLWIVLAAAFATRLLGLVPRAALAGLLVVTGVRLVDRAQIRALHRHRELGVYALTLIGVVCINLLAGVGLGLLMCVLRLVVRIARGRVSVATLPSGLVRLELAGPATFLLVPKLRQAIASIPPKARVHLYVDAALVDYSVRDALTDWTRRHTMAGGQVVTRSEHVQAFIGEAGATPALAEEVLP